MNIPYFAEECFQQRSSDLDLPQGSPSYSCNTAKLRLSPVSPRKYNTSGSTDFKTSAKLSSPSLVSRNVTSEPVVNPIRTESTRRSHQTGRRSPSRIYKTGRESPSISFKADRDSPSKNNNAGRDSPGRSNRASSDSPSRNYKTAIDKKLQTKHTSDNIVLRQPKKSEMTYFGVSVSPKPVTKKLSPAVVRKQEKMPSDKPDLLQHYKKTVSPKVKSRHKSPDAANIPIYENLKNKHSRDFDSSILDELTKAADQILQAVNDYEKEETFTRNLTDEDNESKSKNTLETIAETKSWKPDNHGFKAAPQNTKARLRHTSSTSSVDSVSTPRVKSSQQKPAKPAAERQRRKSEKTENPARVNTKARRLQRASSREALLQSHGSSSEDLPAKVELQTRKPRMVKKTKAMQFSMTNGPELKQSSSSSRSTVKKDDSGKEER